MRTLLFSNNAETTLIAALSALPDNPGFYTLEVTPDGSADTFADHMFDGPTPMPDDDAGAVDGQLATLTHTSLAGSYEVVLLTQRHTSPDGFHVVRGLEMSGDLGSPPAWPIGTKLQARVTAGTLRSFVQGSASSLLRIDGQTLVSSVLSPPEPFEVDSAPSLLRTPRNPTSAVGNAYHALGNGMPVVGASKFVDLGVPTVFSQPGGYNQGDVFVPATPDGYQYGVYSASGATCYLDAGDPTVVFPGDGEVIDAVSATAEVMFHLIPTPLPLLFNAARYNNALLVVDEVGFIAEQVTATTAPVVSVGYNDASFTPHPTHFADGVSLTQITGSQQIHRISAAMNGALAQTLIFKLDTAATGGVFRGRFYWRGFLVQPFE